MIIKRKQAGQLLPTAPEAQGQLSHGAAPEERLDWTEDSVEAGLVPDRRSSDQKASERRRGYRRIEDRDLISKAYEEANAIRENAQAQGFEEGLQRAEASLEEMRQQMAELLNGREEALASVANEIAAIAVEVAARVIKTEVSCDETLVTAIVQDTIQKAGRNNKTILIKLHPDDVATVRRFLKEEPIPNLQAELILMDDPTVDQGSCVLETNSGLIDASFSTQLGILRQLFGGGTD